MTKERSTGLKAVIAKPQPELAVVLENVFNPYNVSVVMRICNAVRVQDVYLLNTKTLSIKNEVRAAAPAWKQTMNPFQLFYRFHWPGKGNKCWRSAQNLSGG